MSRATSILKLSPAKISLDMSQAPLVPASHLKSPQKFNRSPRGSAQGLPRCLIRLTSARIAQWMEAHGSHGLPTSSEQLLPASIDLRLDFSH